MTIVIAPDKFKDGLGAPEVCAAIADGLRSVDPKVELDECPMADGGEGTVAALIAATGGRLETRHVTGPLPDTRVHATLGVLGDGDTVAIEMASASGLALLGRDLRDPMRTTTYGTGELVMAAAELGAKRIILGLGGSATVDGGVGCAQACGARIRLAGFARKIFLDRAFTGADLSRVTSIDTSSIAERLRSVQITAACDVDNPLYGPRGAACIFGPQKGAGPRDVAELDQGLKRLAARTGAQRMAVQPGAGAAGGMGFAMLAFFGASLGSGLAIVSEATRLRQRLKSADLCITAEGSLDAQSLAGKTTLGVARLCKELGVPCIVLAGQIGPGAADALDHGVSAYFSICDRPMTLEEAVRQTPRLLASTAAQVMRALGAKARPKR